MSAPPQQPPGSPGSPGPPGPPEPPGPSPTPLGSGWHSERRSASAADLHAAELGEPWTRTVWLCRPLHPALVLGSTQRSVVGSDSSTTEVVVRRSGGGAVLVDPAWSVWIDVFLPRSDPWWVDDVGRSARWLGWTWVRALGSLGIGAEVYEGALTRDAASGAACFAGLAPGEVVSQGRKVVGISQRRTRAGARLQCMAYAKVHPIRELVERLAVLGAATDDPAALERALVERTGPLDVTVEQVERAFLEALGPPR